jgi:hypothetical protein
LPTFVAHKSACSWLTRPIASEHGAGATYLLTFCPVPAAAEKGELLASVSQDIRLDNRVLDLRTPANQAIFKLQHAVCQVGGMGGAVLCVRARVFAGVCVC